jgi:hypothetical protein
MIENNRFEVDFFQLEKLIEASWSGQTILQFCVLQDLINVHFYKMSDSQRKAIHSFFTTKMTFEKQLYNEDTNEVREKIIARFDPNNQVFIKDSEFEGSVFLFKDRYWKDANTYFEENKINITLENLKNK